MQRFELIFSRIFTGQFLLISDYDKPHYIININYQTRNWNENQSASKTWRFYF